ATGKYPFEPNSAAEVMKSIATCAPTPPSRVRSAFDPALENLILRMLEKDYNSRPSAVDVEHALLASFDAGTDSVPLVPVVRKRRRMVGRERELAELQARLKGVRFGAGFVVAIGGEPGIGKTTLVLDFLDEVQAGGQDCAIGRGRSSERLAGTE